MILWVYSIAQLMCVQRPSQFEPRPTYTTCSIYFTLHWQLRSESGVYPFQAYTREHRVERRVNASWRRHMRHHETPEAGSSTFFMLSLKHIVSNRYSPTCLPLSRYATLIKSHEGPVLLSTCKHLLSLCVCVCFSCHVHTVYFTPTVNSRQDRGPIFFKEGRREVASGLRKVSMRAQRSLLGPNSKSASRGKTWRTHSVANPP